MNTQHPQFQILTRSLSNVVPIHFLYRCSYGMTSVLIDDQFSDVLCHVNTLQFVLTHKKKEKAGIDFSRNNDSLKIQN